MTAACLVTGCCAAKPPCPAGQAPPCPEQESPEDAAPATGSTLGHDTTQGLLRDVIRP